MLKNVKFMLSFLFINLYTFCNNTTIEKSPWEEPLSKLSNSPVFLITSIIIIGFFFWNFV